MNGTWILTTIIVAVVLGVAGIAGIIGVRRRKGRAAKEPGEQLQEQFTLMAADIKAAIGEMNLTALTQVSDQLARQAGEKVETATAAAEQELARKKDLIEAALGNVNTGIDKMTKAVGELSTRSGQQFGEIGNQLAATAKSTSELSKETNSLRGILHHTHARGQLGEFILDGVLRAAGILEGVHCEKQRPTPKGTRSDVSVRVGQDKWVNVDSKFPFSNLWKAFDAETDAEEEAFEAAFIQDVHNRVNEIGDRDYINHETVDVVILFISSEGVYSHILEKCPTIFEYAMERRVVLAGPFALFALLSVIKQGNDNYIVEKKSLEILDLMRSFRLQYEKFVTSLEALGKKLDAANKAYDALTSSRKRQLDRQLSKIEALQEQTEVGTVVITESGEEAVILEPTEAELKAECEMLERTS